MRITKRLCNCSAFTSELCMYWVDMISAIDNYYCGRVLTGATVGILPAFSSKHRNMRAHLGVTSGLIHDTRAIPHVALKMYRSCTTPSYTIPVVMPGGYTRLTQLSRRFHRLAEISSTQEILVSHRTGRFHLPNTPDARSPQYPLGTPCGSDRSLRSVGVPCLRNPTRVSYRPEMPDPRQRTIYAREQVTPVGSHRT